LTHERQYPSGTLFSLLHAMVQLWQPMQRRWSTSIPQRLGRVVSGFTGPVEALLSPSGTAFLFSIRTDLA
jgi:hypothetical protein